MLYLGIDQHARQLTISLRDDSGDVLPARQVSTRPEKIHAFFTKLTRGSELAKYVEYLKAENRILRARLPKQVHTRPNERERLLKLGKAINADFCIGSLRGD
jgi:hypothetical protein